MEISTKTLDLIVLAAIVFCGIPAVILATDSGTIAAYLASPKYLVLMQIFNGINILMLIFICYYLARIERKIGTG